MTTRNLGTLVCLAIVGFMAGFVYEHYIKQMLWNTQISLPTEFQETFANFYECIELHNITDEFPASSEASKITNCFKTNRKNLLSVSKATFTSLARIQYEQFVFTPETLHLCLDFVPFINNETNILLAIKSCTINAYELNKSVNRIKNSNNSGISSLIIGFAIISVYMYHKQYLIQESESPVIENENGGMKLKPTVLKHQESNLEENKHIPIVRPIAQFKPFARLNIAKRTSQNFAKPYPMPIKFPNAPVPLLMFPTPNLPGIPMAKTLPSPQQMESIYYRNGPMVDNMRFQRIGSDEYPSSVCGQADVHLKQVWKSNTSGVKCGKGSSTSCSDGVSSTPKKQKLSPIKNSDVAEGNCANFDTHNILDDLDDLYLDIAESQFDSDVNKAGKTDDFNMKTAQKDITTTIESSSNQLNGGNAENKLSDDSVEKDDSRYDNDLAEKVALNVIGNDKDNQQKLPCKVNHPYPYPAPTVPYNWTFSPNANFNLPFYGIKSSIGSTNMNMTLNMRIASNNNIRQTYPSHMASPLVGNPIWNTHSSTDTNTASNCYY